MSAQALSDEIKAKIAACAARGLNKTQASTELGINRNTVRKYWPVTIAPEKSETPAGGVSLPAPAPEAGGPTLPDAVELSYEPVTINDAGTWGVINDIHIPYHDTKTILAAVREWKDRNVKGILLNGDTLDFYRLSHHYKEPDKHRTKDEVEKGRQLLEWLRDQFPRARIVFKEGNHDERLRKYLAERAPEVFDLDDFHLPNILRAENHGVEWVGGKRVVMLGKLPVVHGHEFARGGGVMPARWLYLRAGSSALCGHFHQISQYTFRTLDRRKLAVWSLGCACFLSPEWLPNNQWVHGYGVVEIANDGWAHVSNRQVENGRVV